MKKQQLKKIETALKKKKTNKNPPIFETLEQQQKNTTPRHSSTIQNCCRSFPKIFEKNLPLHRCMAVIKNAAETQQKIKKKKIFKRFQR